MTKPVAFGLLAFSLMVANRMQADQPITDLPAAWQTAWKRPAAEDRPLQIVHGINLRGHLPEGIGQMLPGNRPDGIARAGMQYYQQRGLGGVVCNVAFQDYMHSAENWKILAAAVKACRELGMVMWIYDEQGYPSGAAGGLVLKENPAYEAKELAFDASRDDPFVIRAAYEHTHASNNYYAARRYVNLLDDRAVACFIDKTHEAYRQRLEPFFGSTIQAMFTDEPSLIAVNIGRIPEEARKRVPIVDAVSPGVKLLPRVPWSYDLADRYQRRFGEDLLKQRRSLFLGGTAEDRRVRRQFWSLVAELVTGRYFGALAQWCDSHRLASSGHSLWEEEILHHVPLEGNGLKALGRMHIPGLDMLSSDPETVIHRGWLTAALPASAARLNARRRVMTEVSDFSQKMAGKKPAGLDEMQATAAWQAAWDVTDFTLYYGIGDRSADDYRAYCDFVGRLNAVLKKATPDPEVLLYYPIYDLWAEYLPVPEPLRLQSQTPRAQRLVVSFRRLGQTLQRSQIPFTLIDHEHLAAAQVQADGLLVIARQRYRAIVLPADVELPAESVAVVEQFARRGGCVLHDDADSGTKSPGWPSAALRPAWTIRPASARVALGRFLRDGRRIAVVVNVGREPYKGKLDVSTADKWLMLDPATGSIDRASQNEDGDVSLALSPRQTQILVQASSGPPQAE